MPRRVYLPVFPRTVCDECRACCVWERWEGSPDSSAWMMCTGCGKTWNQAELNYTPAIQMKNMRQAVGAFQDLTLRAMVSQQERTFLNHVWSKIQRVISGSNGKEFQCPK